MINPTVQANDYAAINQGQLKNIAKQALAEMDAHLPVDSQDGLHLLLTGWNQPGAATNDYVAVNLGQVKTVAKFFYARFQAEHYTDRFPWTGSPTPANDFAPANIGQVKNLFSFDFAKDGAGLDLDHNGLPDRWEITNFGHTGVDPYADPDDDGLTNRQEYVLGADPNDYTNNGSRAVLLTSPISGKTYPASANVYASATTVMPGSVVTKVEFYADAAKIGESLAEPYGVTWSHPSIGSHSLVAVATDDQGLTVSSRSATIQVAAAPPQVSLVSAKPTYTQTAGQLIARVMGVDLSGLSSLTLNGQPIKPTVGQFALNVTLANGDNLFTLVATDSQGRSGQAVVNVLCVTTSLMVAISEPPPNASINYARINVKGTISGASPMPPLASLTVDGVKAFVMGSSFTALNVPTTAGSNTLTAQAMDVAGNVSTASVNVTGTTSDHNGLMKDPVNLQASPRSGVGPLPVTLTPQINVTDTIQEISYDFDGDGAIDQTTTASASILHSYRSYALKA